MPVMYSCCFWFSVRLGSLFVGVISLLEASAAITALVLGLEHEKEVSSQIGEWISNYKMLFLQNGMESLRDDTHTWIITLMALASVYAFLCLLMMYGAYQCSFCLMLPWVVIDIMRLVTMSCLHIIAMVLLKNNILDLGFLIACSCIGGFIMLYLYYLWGCVLSMCQIVRELEKTEPGLDLEEEEEYYMNKGNFPGKIGSAYSTLPEPAY